ncbi:MAG: hypothetical protein GTO05_08925, partial [Gemmatimonadales bacterium]|nr:hypothetical protein [Gemmatimonadales bacterium]
MKRSWILAALALLAAPPVAQAAPDEGNVTSISVLPSPGQALVVIDVTGAVNVSDFTLN